MVTVKNTSIYCRFQAAFAMLMNLFDAQLDFTVTSHRSTSCGVARGGGGSVAHNSWTREINWELAVHTSSRALNPREQYSTPVRCSR